MSKKQKQFKESTKGFGKSFVEMGSVMLATNTKLPSELQVVLIAKLGIAEDLIAEVCRSLKSKEIAKKSLAYPAG